MKKFLSRVGFAMGSLAVVLFTGVAAQAQVDIGVGGNANAGVGGRVGQGVQRATQGVGNAVNRAQQGVQNVQRGVSNAAQGTVRRTQQGVQNLRNGVTQQGQQLQGRIDANSNTRLQAGNGSGTRVGGNTFVQANTPRVPARVKANAQVNAQADRNASWRKTRHNGEWWYYAPNGNWMYHRDGQWNKYSEQDFRRPDGRGGYTAAFRGQQNNSDRWMRDGQPVYRIQADGQGRQFIRYNGQQIWIGNNTAASANADQGNDSGNANIDAGLDAASDVGTGNSAANAEVGADAAVDINN